MMTAAQFIEAINKLPFEDRTEGLLKEISTLHFGEEAVCVTTQKLDLDTDGGADPGILWDKTHQSDTSLHWPKGSPVDSNATKFVVIPGKGWGQRHGIRCGDVGLATIHGADKVVEVIVADIGPANKIGEASLAFFREFGEERVINRRIKDVGIDKPFIMLLFRHSGDGECHNNADNKAKAWQRFTKLQGLKS